MRVFISSTAKDLFAYRQAAERVVQQIGWQPVLLMEHHSVPGGPIVQSCRQLVWQCDVFVLIVGHRCGWVPSLAQGGNGVDSMTAIEFATWIERVRQRGGFQPIIMFATGHRSHDDPSEDADSAAFQVVFRRRVRGLHIVHDFEYDEAAAIPQTAYFSSMLRTQLAHYKTWLADEEVRRLQAEKERQRNDKWAIGALALGLGIWLGGSGGEDGEHDDE